MHSPKINLFENFIETWFVNTQRIFRFYVHKILFAGIKILYYMRFFSSLVI